MSKTVGSTTTQYVYSGQDLIEERDGSGAVLARYIYAGGIDNPVAVVQGTNTYFYQQDALGNVTAITDNTGAIVESYTYDVFGQPTIKDGDGDPVSEPMQPRFSGGGELPGCLPEILVILSENSARFIFPIVRVLIFWFSAQHDVGGIFTATVAPTTRQTLQARFFPACGSRKLSFHGRASQALCGD